jgi:hypothetical protein
MCVTQHLYIGRQYLGSQLSDPVKRIKQQFKDAFIGLKASVTDSRQAFQVVHRFDR